MVSKGTEAAVEIRQAGPDDWAALRQVRLAALAEAPYAFGSTLDTEIDRPERHWRARIAGWPQFIAWAGAEPVGIAAGFAEPADDDDCDQAGARGNWHLVSMWGCSAGTTRPRAPMPKEPVIHESCISRKHAQSGSAADMQAWPDMRGCGRNRLSCSAASACAHRNCRAGHRGDQSLSCR